MNVTVLIKSRRGWRVRGERLKALKARKKEQTLPLCPRGVQKSLGLMGDEDAQPPVGYSSNYAT